MCRCLVLLVLSCCITTAVVSAGEEPEAVTIVVGEGDQLREHRVLAEEPDPVRAFGVRRSAPIGSGLVIFRNQVFIPPLVVERRGLEILVNDQVLEPGMRWPIPRPPQPQEDPGAIPEGLPAAPSDDDEITAQRWFEYWGNKYWWLKSAHPGDYRTRMARALAEHPEVAQASIHPDDDEDFMIVTATGETLNVTFEIMGQPPVPLSHEVKSLVASYDNMVGLLSQDAVLLVFSSEHRFYPKPFGWKLASVLLGPGSEEEKIAWLIQENLLQARHDEIPESRVLFDVDRAFWLEPCRIRAEAAVMQLIQDKLGADQ
jgi:hypothetical protein